MSNDGKSLFSQSQNEIIEFKIDNDTIFEGHNGYVNTILLGKSNEKLFTCSTDHTARVFNTTNGECLKVFSGHTHKTITDLQINNENTVLFTCSLDKTCKSWNISTGECINTFKGHTNGVKKIIYSKTTFNFLWTNIISDTNDIQNIDTKDSAYTKEIKQTKETKDKNIKKSPKNSLENQVIKIKEIL